MEPINESSMGMAEDSGIFNSGGMTPREAPEEEFYVGRTNDARGARLKEY